MLNTIDFWFKAHPWVALLLGTLVLGGMIKLCHRNGTETPDFCKDMCCGMGLCYCCFFFALCLGRYFLPHVLGW